MWKIQYYSGDQRLKSKFNVVTSGNGTNRDKIQECEFYVALVTPSFVSNEFCLGEMKDAKALGKEMYAIVKNGTQIPKIFNEIDWKLILFFSNDMEFETASETLKGAIENVKHWWKDLYCLEKRFRN